MPVVIHDPAKSAAPMAPTDAVVTRAPVPDGWDEYRSADGAMVVLAARRLTVRDRLHYYAAIPARLQENPLWMQLAMAIACIKRVNGEPVPIPEGPREIEALLARVGDDVVDQINGANIARMAVEFQEIEAKAKNLQGTPSSASA
jgi:hypothetical protein